MENYNKVKEFCEENGCKLLTMFEEFEEKRLNVTNKYYQYVRIDFVGVCGHNSSAVVTNFLKRKTGIRCKDCVKENSKLALKNRVCDCQEVEHDSIKIIEKYLSEKYNIIRTKEGCRADLAIKKKGDETDVYLGIQIKATQQISHKMYSFNYINKDYGNMLVICICISENKIWVIPHDDIKHLKYLRISKCSKYNKYLVKDNNMLSDDIERYSANCMKFPLDAFMIPVYKLQQREQEYVRKRETNIDFLKYEYPEIQNTPTDFIVNGKKVQEKVAGIAHKGNSSYLVAGMASNNGKKENGSRNFRSYRLGENEYYWLHSSIDDRFWIVPESVLFERGLLAEKGETKNRKSIKICKTTTWLKPFEYDYCNIDKDRITKLFE
jgi:hypothetical protein